jgi:hypothetical protein
MPAPFDQTVRQLLLDCWGRQACRDHPQDWPDVLASLMQAAPASPHTSFENKGRGSLKPAVDYAVAMLAQAFTAGPPVDAPMVVWQAFPKLDRAHCAELAGALTAAHQRITEHTP